MELGPEDVSLLERCPHFRGWYVPEDAFLASIFLTIDDTVGYKGDFDPGQHEATLCCYSKDA